VKPPHPPEGPSKIFSFAILPGIFTGRVSKIFSFFHFSSFSNHEWTQRATTGSPDASGEICAACDKLCIFLFPFAFIRFYSISCEANREWTPMDAKQAAFRSGNGLVFAKERF
jgi:hypothetical protein